MWRHMFSTAGRHNASICPTCTGNPIVQWPQISPSLGTKSVRSPLIFGRYIPLGITSRKRSKKIECPCYKDTPGGGSMCYHAIELGDIVPLLDVPPRRAPSLLSERHGDDPSLHLPLDLAGLCGHSDEAVGAPFCPPRANLMPSLCHPRQHAETSAKCSRFAVSGASAQQLVNTDASAGHQLGNR